MVLAWAILVTPSAGNDSSSWNEPSGSGSGSGASATAPSSPSASTAPPSGELSPQEAHEFVKKLGGPEGAAALRERQREQAKSILDAQKEIREQQLKAILGEQGFRDLQDALTELNDAHRSFQTTGKVPETKHHLAPIEIMTGRVMTREQRYDAMLEHLCLVGTGSFDVLYDKVDPTYLTDKEFIAEWASRETKELNDCTDHFGQPAPKERCAKKVKEKYQGRDYVEACDARLRGMWNDGAYVEAIAPAGPVGLAGRAIGRAVGWALGGDDGADKGEQWGAVLTGPADMGTQALGAAHGQQYTPPSSNVDPISESSSIPKEDTRPASEPPQGGSDNGNPPHQGGAPPVEPATRPVKQESNSDPAYADTATGQGSPPSSPGSSGTKDSVAPAANPGGALPPKPSPKGSGLFGRDPSLRVDLKTPNGAETISLEEYNRRWTEAASWVEDQARQLAYQEAQKNPYTNKTPSSYAGELYDKAADKFGLQKGWQGIGNEPREVPAKVVASAAGPGSSGGKPPEATSPESASPTSGVKPNSQASSPPAPAENAVKPGSFGPEDVAFGLVKANGKFGALNRFRGQARSGMDAPISDETAGSGPGIEKQKLYARDTLLFARQLLASTPNGRLRFNLEGFNVDRALTEPSYVKGKEDPRDPYFSITSNELRGILSDPWFRSRVSFYDDAGQDVTAKILASSTPP